jgi:hypothetical protein
MTKIEGSGSESGSISQRHGSADPEPDSDPPQNVMDPQHCEIGSIVVPYPHRSALICMLVPLRLEGSRASVLYSDPVGSGIFWPVRIPNQNDRSGFGSGSQSETE